MLARVVGPEFAKSAQNALVEQNRYPRHQIVLTLGAVLVTGLGGLQAVIPEERWPGLLLVVLGLVLTAIGRAAAELGTFERFSRRARQSPAPASGALPLPLAHLSLCDA